MRRDAWWIQPAIVFTVFTAFIVYATWAAFQNAYYTSGPYLSPFYSPEFFGSSPHAWFGPQPGWWPGWLPFSPALIILPFPGLFRFTCYYYRGAYYKAFWMDPVSCSVGEPRNSYIGEKSFPLILQNIHRYFWYAAVFIWAYLTYDAFKAMFFETTPGGPKEFGIGVGTIILLANSVFIALYTFGCHSARHILGGFKDTLSGNPVRKTAYACSSCLNRWHSKWAWASLFSVAFADIYIRMCAMGIWTDYRLF
jgi:hypothetical protein